MKQSHFKTPRTMDECHFALNSDPIEKPGTRDKTDLKVMIGLVVSLLALVVIVAFDVGGM